ncbi:MAG: hypothetical protein KF852_07745 [Saprospiraceae bacterium]|nr:hypothetical protein [Saprospiraceae bacterium]
MKLRNSLFIALFGALLLTAAGCEKEASNEITINIISPVADQVMANPGSVLIHIEFEATEENEAIEVYIHRDGNVNDVVFEWDTHEHDKKIVLMETIDLSSYPSGTKFHLEAEACKDHDCKNRVSKHIEFTIP